jgi:hypothetical protein
MNLVWAALSLRQITFAVLEFAVKLVVQLSLIAAAVVAFVPGMTLPPIL